MHASAAAYLGSFALPANTAKPKIALAFRSQETG